MYKTGPGRGTVRLYLKNQRSLQMELPGDLIGGQYHSQRRSRDLAVADQLRHHPIDLVHRDREPDPRVSSRRTVDRGVDTDQPAGAVQQRAARVAGVDGRVRL